MECRIGCAACCTEISISSPIPGMPNGKPAGTRCVNLNNNNECTIHQNENYPNVCR
ncbi:MAG: YkgJ family cysteine cluster protein, partial [Fibrobacteres bacterium]|nr:YkgJ family cysteine cluster protein [Fibrobacterota bacterium]